MRRVILLALLALALPTAALASSFDYPSGDFVSGIVNGSFITGGSISLFLHGTTNTIAIVTGTLTMVSPTLFTFTGGMVAVPTQSGFTNALADGSIIEMGDDVAISANLAPNAMVKSGSAAFDFNFTGFTIDRGSAGVQGQFVPEPGTLGLLELGLLGNGVIGLAGMVRRKLKLGT